MAGKKVAVSCVLAGALILVSILLFQGIFLPEGDPVVFPSPEGGSPDAAGRDPDSAESEGLLEPEEEPVAAEESPPAEGSEAVVPEGPLALEGRVTGEGGKGIEGARVLAVDVRRWGEVFSGVQGRFQGDPLDGMRHLRAAFEEAGREVPSARSDGDGRYGFRDLPPGERRVLVSHPDHLPHSESWVFIAEEVTARCDVVLVEGFRISGRVVDDEGDAVAGAVVRAVASERRDVQGAGRMIQMILSLADAEMLVAPGEAVTGKDGSFSLGSLAPVPQDVEVSGEGYLRTLARKIPPGTSDLILALRKGLTLQGRVLEPEGEPARDAEVRLVNTRGSVDFNNPGIYQELGDLLENSPLETRTSDDGIFELQGAEEGFRELCVQAEGFPELRLPLEIRASSPDLGELRLPAPASIAGRVVDPAGVGVPGALVSVSKPDPERGPFTNPEKLTEGITGRDGYFTLAGFAEGAYELRAEHQVRGEATLAAVQTGRRDVVLRLEEGFTIRGHVVEDATDVPVPGAQVQSIGSSRSTTTDEAGGFVLQGITRESAERFGGNVLLRVTHRDFQADSASVPFGDEEPLEVRLQIRRGIAGLVTDVEGNPVEGARVWLEVPGVPRSLFLMDPRSALEATYSDAEGSFFLQAPARGGNMGLEIVAARTDTGRGRMALPEKSGEGDWPSVQLVLEPGLTLRGRVVDSEGAAVPRARVTAVRVVEQNNPEFQVITKILPADSGRTAYSSQDGGYELRDLDPGTYQLSVAAHGYAKQLIEGVEILAAETTQDVLLEAGKSISGRVVDFTGVPLEGVEVLAFVETEPPEGERTRGMHEIARAFENASGSGVARTRTDEGGRFSLTHLPEGVFRVVARAVGFEVGVVPDVSPGEQVDDIVLVPFARVVGRVVDAQRRAPVNGFRVELRRLEDEGASVPRPVASSRLDKSFQDPAGEFLLENIPPGRFRIWVSSKGYAPFNRVFEVDPGGEAVVDAVLRVGAEVTGVVRSALDGQPVEGIQVYVNRQARADDPGYSRSDTPMTRTKEDGSFSLEGLADGDYHIGFSSDDWYVSEGRALTRFSVPSGQPLHFEVKLLPAGKVEGRISGLQFDEGTRYYLLSLVSEEGSDASRSPQGGSGKAPPPRRYSTGVSGGGGVAYGGSPPGTFSLGSVPPGAYRVEVSRPQEAGASGSVQPQVLGTVEIRAGETTRFDAAMR